MRLPSALKTVATVACALTMSLGGPAALNAAPAQVANGDSEATQSQLERRIISMERAGLDALKAGNLELFGSLTADDAVLIDAHGPANKAQVLKNVQSFKLLDYEMADVRVRAISKTSGLVTYEIKEAGTSHGEDFTARAYISSIWMKRHGKWVCTFSQETAAR